MTDRGQLITPEQPRTRGRAVMLLPVHRKWVQKILSGEKTTELRLARPHVAVTRIMLWETAPTSAIVGEVRLAEIRRFPADMKGWVLGALGACVSWEDFERYVGDREHFYAYELTHPVPYPKHVDSIGMQALRPPRGIAYLSWLQADAVRMRARDCWSRDFRVGCSTTVA